MATRAFGDDGPAASPSAAATGDESAAAGGTAGDAGLGPNEPASETPGKRKRRMMTESHLLSAEGLKKIHRTFPYQVSSDVSGQEAKALRSLVNMYTQWAFDLYPGLNFADFLERTEFLGRQHGVQGLMSDLREKERKRALRLEREAEAEEDDEQAEDEERSASAAPDQQHQDDDEGEEAML